MGRTRAIVAGVGGGIVLAVGLTVTLNANAYCCDPWGVPGANAFMQAGTSVVEAITSAVATVVNEVETGPLYTWEQGMGKAYTEMSKHTASDRVIEEGAIEAKTKLYLAGEKADASERAVEPAMLDQTISNTLVLAEGQTGAANINHGDDASFADALVDAPYAGGDRVVDRHLSTYCDSQHADAGLCTGTFNSDYDQQNADVRIGTLYGTSAYDESTRAAALAFVGNVVSPTSLRASPDGAGEQREAVEAMTLSDQAALALAAHSFNAQIADRTLKHHGGSTP